jgi:hypothetical protein
MRNPKSTWSGFRVWLARIDRRDYFGAPRRAEAHAAVERAPERLRRLSPKAFARDASPGGQPAPLRAVEDNA